MNPADAPILFFALTSETAAALRSSTNTRRRMLAQRMSMVAGVPQVQVFGWPEVRGPHSARPGVARQPRDRHRRSRVARFPRRTSACRPACSGARIARPRSSANGQLQNAEAVQKHWWSSYRNGAPVRLGRAGQRHRRRGEQQGRELVQRRPRGGSRHSAAAGHEHRAVADGVKELRRIAARRDAARRRDQHAVRPLGSDPATPCTK